MSRKGASGGVSRLSGVFLGFPLLCWGTAHHSLQGSGPNPPFSTPGRSDSVVTALLCLHQHTSRPAMPPCLGVPQGALMCPSSLVL